MRALRKILVVDDDPVVGKSFDRVLSEKGYVVITARDGEEALRKLREEDYDAVFTDIRMPGMDGIEVAERVKAKRPWIPVVIVTGYGTDANEARAREAGVAAFLHKPLSPEVIEGSAREALMEKEAPAAAKNDTEAAAKAAPVAAEKETASRSAMLALKNVALFLAAPFVGLAYVLAFPFVGLGVLAWMGAKALAKHGALRKVALFVKNVALFLAAPFVGLAYIVAFPFVGLGMLAWTGIRAWVNRNRSE
jgi:CheY-like chemotaxis protein